MVVHHPEVFSCDSTINLKQIVSNVLKSMKSPRSQLSKSAIMCMSDIIHTLGDQVIDLLDVEGLKRPGESILYQLLLKASANDKKFVVDEAKAALVEVATSLGIGPVALLLMPYVKEHKNPKIRGHAASTLALAVEHAHNVGDVITLLNENGLVQLSGSLLTDKSTEAREAARIILREIKVSER